MFGLDIDRRLLTLVITRSLDQANIARLSSDPDSIVCSLESTVCFILTTTFSKIVLNNAVPQLISMAPMFTSGSILLMLILSIRHANQSVFAYC
jgi:hypothetical protein